MLAVDGMGFAVNVLYVVHTASEGTREGYFYHNADDLILGDPSGSLGVRPKQVTIEVARLY
jgi:hypothetical protein